MTYEVGEGQSDSGAHGASAEYNRRIAMQLSGNCLGAPELDYESWRNVMRALCCWYTPQVGGSKPFAGKTYARTLYGLLTADISCNAHRVERKPRDLRLDDMDHYYAIFQIGGQSTVIQNDRAVELAAGNVALIDAARPVTYFAENGDAQWRSVKLPRAAVITHFGFEPQGGSSGSREAQAGRLLVSVLNSVEDEYSISAANSYMELAIYDLLGALFAPSDKPSISTHTDRLFKRVCDIVKDRFTDPNFGPCDIAAEMGISQRYLQKLFTARGLICQGYIQSVRLDNAARLLHRRKRLDTRQPLSEIACACGFNDYGNFARRFHRRFGHSPSGHAADQ